MFRLFRAVWPHYSTARRPCTGWPSGSRYLDRHRIQVKHSEEIQISWLREPLEFPEDRLYTPHTAGSCSRATGIPGEDGAQWYGASQTPESGLCEFAFQSAESTSPYFSPHFFFFFSVVAIPFFTPTRSEGRSRWTAAHSPGSDTLLQAIRRLYAYA